MKVLVLNTGSSSVKYRVFECDGEVKDLAHGQIERIGLDGANIKCDCALPHNPGCAVDCLGGAETLNIPDHAAAIEMICKILQSAACGVIDDLSEIEGIGHRVVHGGEEFSKSRLIDDAVISGIDRCARLAPLHNPPALQGIKGCARVFAGTPQVAVFDTAFHSSIPAKAFRYALPKSLYTDFGVRKYGFHGTSHRFVSEKAIKLLDKPVEDTKIITCHLGNGSSITAVRGGRSVDTSMGLTPLPGVIMGTRSGDLDPYIPLFMMKEAKMTVEEVDSTLNKKSGLEGICGHNDMRDVEQRAEAGDADCILALDMFAYRVAQYIGSYATVMNGVDAIVFTAGIGEHGDIMRKRILEHAEYLGVDLDEAKNTASEREITSPTSTVKVFVIPTNEELIIARDTARLVAEKSAAPQTAAVE
ncbi:MAG: acetate kinase [bacterium]|nr:acetate kinase [bacterium]